MNTIRIAAQPSELRDGLIIANIVSAYHEQVALSSVADLEAHAARVAAVYGKPCSIWITFHGKRKPRGFDDEARRISSIFYPNDAAATKGTMP